VDAAGVEVEPGGVVGHGWFQSQAVCWRSQLMRSMRVMRPQ